MTSSTPTVWFFNDSGSAYDFTMCDDKINMGDILVIPSEKVVGIAETYPFALSKESGELHALKICAEDYINKNGISLPDPITSLRIARTYVKCFDLGYDIDDTKVSYYEDINNYDLKLWLDRAKDCEGLLRDMPHSHWENIIERTKARKEAS